jgi:uncharacterized protein (DUF1501 family)
MPTQSRREFLNGAGRLLSGGAAAALVHRLGLVNARAQSANCDGYKALVCVFLFGGNDANNTVVPVRAAQNHADYARIRGVLALSETQLQQITARTGGAVYGLHPRLSDLRALYEQGRMAVVLNVGTLAAPLTRAQYQQSGAVVPANLFSHSDQQAEWQNSSATAQTATGWGGRVADRMASCNTSQSFPTVLSLSGNTIFGAGQQTRLGTLVPNSTVGLQGFGRIPNPRYTAFQQLLQFDDGVALVKAANTISASGLSDSEAVNAALAAKSKITTAFPNTSLAQQLKSVALLTEVRATLGVRRQVFFCSLGGFDTHQNEVSAHDTLMTQVGPALAAFYKATEELGIAGQVTTFTASEFSRTAQANGNSGADHGWGGHHLILGGAVKGGDVYGKYPTLDLNGPDDANNRGVYIPTIAVDQYNATLAAWFGVATADLNAVFPNLKNFSASNLGFMA